MANIIIDVDCVVADFIGAVLKKANKTDRSVATEYNWWRRAYPDLTPEIDWMLANNKEFWSQLPLINGAKEGIKHIRNQNHTIIWCTAPYRAMFGWESIRRTWLDNNFDARKHGDGVIFTHQKYLVQGLAFIDDRVDMVNEWEKHNRDSIGFVFESELTANQDIQTVNWQKIMDMEFFKRKRTFIRDVNIY